MDIDVGSGLERRKGRVDGRQLEPGHALGRLPLAGYPDPQRSPPACAQLGHSGQLHAHRDDLHLDGLRHRRECGLLLDLVAQAAQQVVVAAEHSEAG